MRKFVVVITLIYVTAVAAALGYLSDWFREGIVLGKSVIGFKGVGVIIEKSLRPI